MSQTNEYNVLPQENKVLDQVNNVQPQGNQPNVQVEGGQFFVKTLTGKNIVISLNPDMTVLQVKDIIFEMERLPQDQMRLIYAGRQLEDNSTLLSNNVTNNSTIHLVLRLKGGNSIIY